jgi:hypothetical protein
MANLSDFLTTMQNVVKAFNSFSQSNIELTGNKNTLNLSTTVQIKTGSGRVMAASITTGGTTVGGLYDAASIGAIGPTNLIIVVPTDVGFFNLNMTFQYGLVYVPGAGQHAAFGYT